MNKLFLMLVIGLSAASALYAENSETATVRFVNKKVQVQRDNAAVTLKMGDKLSLNEKVSIEDNGKLEIEYKGETYSTKKGGTVSAIISGSPSDGAAGFKDSKAAEAAGVRALDGKRKLSRSSSEESGVIDKTISVFTK